MSHGPASSKFQVRQGALKHPPVSVTPTFAVTVASLNLARPVGEELECDLQISSEFGTVFSWFAAELVPVRGGARTNLEAPWIDGEVAKVAVSKTTFLPDRDVNGAGQGHKRAGDMKVS